MNDDPSCTLDETTDKTLRHAIASSFPNEDAQTVMDLLNEYGTEAFERERSRVQMAILELAEGDTDKLLKLIQSAKNDYRDVLMWAASTATTEDARKALTCAAALLTNSGQHEAAAALLSSMKQLRNTEG